MSPVYQTFCNGLRGGQYRSCGPGFVFGRVAGPPESRSRKGQANRCEGAARTRSPEEHGAGNSEGLLGAFSRLEGLPVLLVLIEGFRRPAVSRRSGN